MDKSLKRQKLKNIYRELKSKNLIKTDVNIRQVEKDLKYLNLLLYQSYKIFNSKKSEKEKIEAIHNLKDPNGKRIFTKKLAEKIYNRYNDKFSNLINKLKRRRISRINNRQVGGEFNVEDNKINDIIKFINENPEYKAEVLRVASGIVNSPQVQKVKDYLDDFTVDDAFDIFDWVFFPLYNLENLPLVGFMFEIPLDLISIVLDNSDILMETVMPLIPLAMDLASDAGSAIPIPGVNSAIAAVSVGLAFLEEPLEWFLSDGLDVIGLYINISRKEWGLAYLSAMEVIPQFPTLVDAAVTNMYVANKHIDKGIKGTDAVIDNMILAESMVEFIEKDKYGIFDPVKVWKKVIYPNKDKVKALENIPVEDINNLIPMFNQLKEELKNNKKLMEDLLNSKDSLTTFKGKNFEK
jgi:uncharacterized protein YlxP (DUF503 family)